MINLFFWWYNLGIFGVDMNDFTKKELLLILDGLGDLRFSKFYDENFVELRKKLQSMIENYCEHISNHYEPNIISCEKCGKDLI